MLKRAGSSSDEAPPGAACAGATHLVTGLSVGAFKLLAGGTLHGKVSAGAGSVAGGVSGTRDETVVHEAGDAARCASAARGEPDLQCKSPIQIFLSPLRPRPGAQAMASSSGPPRATPEAPHGPDALHVLFRPDASEGRWLLRGLEGEVLCQLPCSRWVTPRSGVYLQLDAPEASEVRKVELPGDLGYAPGRELVARPRLARGSYNVAGAFAVAGIGVGLGVPEAFKDDCAKGSKGACSAEVVGGVVGGALLVTGLVYLGAYVRGSDKVEVGLAAAAEAAAVPRIRLGARGLEARF